MSHQCNDQSCCHGHEKSHGGCQCGCHNCTCCSHPGASSECHKLSEMLLHLADEAWMEVLKDKIKEDILAKSGDHLTQLARTTSEYNHKRWKDKMEAKKGCEDFDAQLKEIMCHRNK